MKQLRKAELLKLAKGASLMTTGGGLSYDEQIVCIKKLDNPRLKLVTIDELTPESYIVTAGEVGAADAPPIDKSTVARSMLPMLEKATGKKIAALYPPEIGQESIVFEAAHYLDLPIVDFDPVGFRAVPYVDINIFNVKQLPFSHVPLVLANDRDEVFLVSGPIDLERAETILRSMTALSKTGIIFALNGMTQAGVLQQHKLGTNSYSRALALGSILDSKALTAKLAPRFLFSGAVSAKVTKKVKGFLAQEVTIQAQEKYTLVILNEVMMLKNQGGVTIASVPERILLIDEKRLVGIPSGNLVNGLPITVMVVDPEKDWQSKRAQEIFGKERFQALV